MRVMPLLQTLGYWVLILGIWVLRKLVVPLLTSRLLLLVTLLLCMRLLTVMGS